ncbi:MAG: protein translocase subunit SecD [Dehalococcoidia bacterium]|nr:protein translocase subunit SecD [Dehalococcoidia bacterium]
MRRLLGRVLSPLAWVLGTPLVRRTLVIVLLVALATASLAFAKFDVNLLLFRLERDNAGPLGLRLGLDLQGGSHLVYQAVEEGGAKPTPAQMEGVRQTIERRVNPLGVTEPVIQIMGDDRILVQLPGLKNVEETKRLIGEMAVLSFKVREYQPDGAFVDANLNLSGDDLDRGYEGVHPTTNAPVVYLEFGSTGTRTFAEATARIQGTRNCLAIFLDKEELVCPVAEEAILGGTAFISGPDFTQERVRTIAIQLESGRLPIPLQVVQEWGVDASLGSDALAKSLVAGGVGLALVVLFMVLYYRLPGLLAGLSLAFYAVLVVSIFKLFNVTLTLASIAALIISIGMAVDANVLIFERMKEEIRGGRTLRASVEVGFNRAWSAIWDSQITTLIACVILMWFGTRIAASLVVGFALTLAIGVLVSMFTATYVTRTLLLLAMVAQVGRRFPLFVTRDNIPAAARGASALGERS